ncbi:hypothetical protein DFH09DRAFT_1379785 [Mycena vulgaris]|nr:hypothetical protein DFH09DRAFT_1379785 [Mycena vulgaris]
MAYPGQFMPTAMPNDPIPLQLTPQQFIQFQQYQQFLQQQQQQPQTHIPMPPPPSGPPTPFPVSLIDPLLRSTPDRTHAERLESLERELSELKAEKRLHVPSENTSSKRRKKNTKPSPYILKEPKGLTAEQTETRRKLMRMCRTELINLTGRLSSNESDAEDADSESESTQARSSQPRLVFDFSQNVDHETNIKVLDQVATLIWTEQQNTASKTFCLPHKEIKFTRSDLAEFAKGTFRTWRRKWKAEQDETLARKQAKAESENRQLMRRRELKENRLKAVPNFKKSKRRDPAFILETDWMTDEISQPNTDDEERKSAHRRRLVREARLNVTQSDDPLWERVRPGFQSSDMEEIKDALDAILKDLAKLPGKKRPRNRVRRIDLGHTHNRIPAGIVWPFMVSQDWYDANVEGNPDLEEEMQMHGFDPEGFGDA